MFDMSGITIPPSGLSLGNFPQTSASKDVPEFLGLTLSDGVIEDMIKCVQNGKPIQLSLGEHPILSYGTKSQQLSTFTDPFAHEIYKSTRDMAFYDSKTKTQPNGKSEPIKLNQVARMNQNLLGLVGVKMKPWQEKARIPAKVVSTGDAAVDALANSIAVENAKKAENTTKILKGGLPMPGKRGALPPKATNKKNYLNQNSARSMPSSPALSGVESPALGPITSIPLSQQQAEQSKAARKPVIHLLAIEPMSEKEIQRKLTGVSEHDINQALEKVGDLKDGKWELRKSYYKELDVHTYDYKTADDRQRAIDNAVKVYDKMRLSASDPEWDRLLVKSERGTGKCLSKLQASIVSKGPKINVENADSDRDTPGKDDDLLSDKNLSKIKGEAMARSSSQEPVIKKKKMSETEAQSKRLFSKNPPKAAVKVPKAAPKTGAKPVPRPTTKATAKKTLPAKVTGNAKTLSSEYINESDEDDHQRAPVPKPVQKKITKMTKRPREEEVDTSDSSVPLSKKIRKEADAPTHRASEQQNQRISDFSQKSRSTNSSQFSSSNSHKKKSNSPTKSSPLASSPPTNASELDNSSGGHTSSSASPAHNHITKSSHSPIHMRHQKSSSVTSSSSAGSTRYLKPEVTDLARKFKMYYPKYLSLHAEIEGLVAAGRRDPLKEDNLLEMHARLAGMKKDIVAGIVEY